jgi:hypothetical protein
MTIQLNISPEFEDEYNKDRFKESLQRLIADANLLAGNYEKETAIILMKALQDSKEV